ncbi:hypothetical protein NDU88_006976 [Pleurodeles waltl]|uniref:Uncharacterized protein n=1 Tax=Pleurodeles waltl TaxID=8319 RepID=A0AAV7VS71_PLEWA|nr:hypothetical protein NDU88_006976 [Pleurodeles waltl]
MACSHQKAQKAPPSPTRPVKNSIWPSQQGPTTRRPRASPPGLRTLGWPPAMQVDLSAAESWGPPHSKGAAAKRAPAGRSQAGSVTAAAPADSKARQASLPGRRAPQGHRAPEAWGFKIAGGRGPIRLLNSPPAAPLHNLQRTHSSARQPARAERATSRQARRQPNSPPRRRPTGP